MAKTGAHLKIRPFGDNVLGVELLGNPKQPEPDSFRVAFPGGDVDIARASDGSYWVHVRVNREDDEDAAAFEGREHGRLVDGRLDVKGKHASDTDAGDFGHPGLYHLAVRIERAGSR